MLTTIRNVARKRAEAKVDPAFQPIYKLIDKRSREFTQRVVVFTTETKSQFSIKLGAVIEALRQEYIDTFASHIAQDLESQLEDRICELLDITEEEGE